MNEPLNKISDNQENYEDFNTIINSDMQENQLSWAEEAKQDMEDFIESQGIYIRQ